MAESAGIVLVQLDPEAPPGLIPAVAAGQGVPVTVIDASASLPAGALAAVAGLVILGSAAATGSSDAVVAVIRDRVLADRPLLRIDTGASLLTRAIGGTVRAGQSHEFGYVDLSPATTTAEDPMLRVMGTGLPVMEWHNDALDVPAEALVLAHCRRGRVQAFRSGRAAHGLRFHPGATVDIVRRWATLRGVASNNPAIRVRIGAEIVRHQDRAERFGKQVIEARLALV